jgi:hypothetical protein
VWWVGAGLYNPFIRCGFPPRPWCQTPYFRGGKWSLYFCFLNNIFVY